jgi:hypothetical protein
MFTERFWGKKTPPKENVSSEALAVLLIQDEDGDQ